MRSALAIEGELTLRCESAPDVRILARGRSVVVETHGLRHALELYRRVARALPSGTSAGWSAVLQRADLLLELRVRGRKVASVGAQRPSWLATRLGFPGVRLTWSGLALTLLWPRRSAPGVHRHDRPS